MYVLNSYTEKKTDNVWERWPNFTQLKVLKKAILPFEEVMDDSSHTF